MEQAELRETLIPLVEDAGLLLVDLASGRSGRRTMIRLLVDRRGHVTVNECAALARRIKDLLDSGVLPGTEDYRLEVGSPGIGRPLESEADWNRTVGRTLTVELEEGTYTGLLTGYEGGMLRFGDGKAIGTDSVLRAVEVLEEPSEGATQD